MNKTATALLPISETRSNERKKTELLKYRKHRDFKGLQPIVAAAQTKVGGVSRGKMFIISHTLKGGVRLQNEY